MYLVLDIGGTFTKYSYMNEQGDFLSQGKYETVKTNLEDMLEGIGKLITDEVEGIALSSPGVIDADTGFIEVVSLLPFLNGVNLKEAIEHKFNVRCTIENDAKCAALAEVWKGSLKDCQCGLMMVLGSGIGGAICIDGKIYKGQRNKAGELGSILCHDSRRNHIEASFGRACSAVWLVRDIAKVLGLEGEDGKEVFEYINSKNEIAYPIFLDYCKAIAFQIYNLDYVLDLDCIAIGGGISSQPIVVKTISEQFMELRNKYREDMHDPVVVTCQFENDANLIGALYHFKSTFKNS